MDALGVRNLLETTQNIYTEEKRIMARKLSVFLPLAVGVALVVVALALFGVATPQKTARAQEGPAADGAALLDYLLNQDPYTAWGTWNADRWSDFGGLLVSGEPHGNTIRIFVNDVAREAVLADDFDGTLPYGSIVVKENYMGALSNPGEVAALTVMYKVEGFNPQAGDWFWLKAAGDGSAVMAEGAVEGCINCHSQEGNADYLLRYAFGQEPATFYGEPLPQPNSAAVLDYIFNVSPFTEWGSWPANEVDDFSGYLVGNEPHGATVRIWVNERALAALQRPNFDGTLPYGSMIVKANYMGTPEEPGQIAALTIMYKVEGFNPQAGDWYWIKAGNDGAEVAAEGAVEGCINCHAEGTDYVRRFDLMGYAEMVNDEAMMQEGGMDGEGMGQDAMDGEEMEGEGMESDGAMNAEDAARAEELVSTRCTLCHTRDRIENNIAAGRDGVFWERTTRRMVSNGAPINEDERALIAAYLTMLSGE